MTDRQGWAALALALLASPASAALAPEYQRLREFGAVAEAAARALPGKPIDAVERVDAVLYKVRAGSCHLFVRVVFEPNETAMPGPQSFKVIPGAVQCP